MDLPPNYSSFQSNANFFAFLDVNLIPFNCWISINFHDKLLITTLTPIVFILVVAGFYLGACCFLPQEPEGRRTKIEKLRAKSIYVVLIFLYSVFPIVSATVFQTFVFDSRLKSVDYLKADYSIENSDESQQKYEMYAIAMALLYCAGIPIGSFVVLRANKEPIQQLQRVEERIARLRRPTGHVNETETLGELQHQKEELQKSHYMLAALSPLYRDYSPRYWFFEVPKFCCTVVLCGLVTLTGFRDSNQIFLALMVSVGLLLALASYAPYLDALDNMLAMSCQASLSLVMVVGLLKAGDPALQDATFGSFLIACVTINWALGIGSIALTFVNSLKGRNELAYVVPEPQPRPQSLTEQDNSDRQEETGKRALENSNVEAETAATKETNDASPRNVAPESPPRTGVPGLNIDEQPTKQAGNHLEDPRRRSM
jgi:hypothetical protein